MSFEMIATSVLVGLIVGWLAGMAIKGLGRLEDLMLGVGGSVLGSWIFQTQGAVPGSGRVGMAVAVFAGAALVIVVQRKVWPAHA